MLTPPTLHYIPFLSEINKRDLFYVLKIKQKTSFEIGEAVCFDIVFIFCSKNKRSGQQYSKTKQKVKNKKKKLF